MMRGRRLGVDPGDVRIGIALSDPDCLLATPVVTLANDKNAVNRISELVDEHSVVEVYVGLPLNLQGAWTLSTRKAVAFARDIADRISVPVRVIDERLTTSLATRALRDNKRDARRGRSVIDQIAAVSLLQQALEVIRTSGTSAGQHIDEVSGES